MGAIIPRVNTCINRFSPFQRTVLWADHLVEEFRRFRRSFTDYLS
jgi:hypothetical protein